MHPKFAYMKQVFHSVQGTKLLYALRGVLILGKAPKTVYAQKSIHSGQIFISWRPNRNIIHRQVPKLAYVKKFIHLGQGIVLLYVIIKKNVLGKAPTYCTS